MVALGLRRWTRRGRPRFAFARLFVGKDERDEGDGKDERDAQSLRWREGAAWQAGRLRCRFEKCGFLPKAATKKAVCPHLPAFARVIFWERTRGTRRTKGIDREKAQGCKTEVKEDPNRLCSLFL
jgi:hypothetical protein